MAETIQRPALSSSEPKRRVSLFSVLPRRLMTSLVLIALVSLVAAFGRSGSAEPSALPSQRKVLDVDLSWTTAAAWFGTQPDSDLLLIDTVPPARLLQISRGGHLRKALSEWPGATSKAPAAIQWPALVASDKNGAYFLDDATQSVVSFDSSGSLAPKSISFSSLRAETTPIQVVGVYDFSPADDGVVAFVDNAANVSQYVYVREDHSATILGTIPPFGPESTYVKLGIFRAMAVIGDYAYLLRFLETPVIERVRLKDGKASVLASLPAPFDARPMIETQQAAVGGHGATQAIRNLRVVEKASLPYGIFTWDNQLFLLLRERADDSYSPIWRLQRIDIATGRAASETTLPTRAGHLVAVPGETWAFLEKSLVVEKGHASFAVKVPYMTAHHLLLIEHKDLEQALDMSPVD